MALAKSSRVEIRVTDLEKADWATKAGGTRRVSDWLRSLANAAPFPGGVVEQVDTPASSTGGPSGREGSSPSPAIKRKPRAGCARAHFHRPGVYCASCEKLQ